MTAEPLPAWIGQCLAKKCRVIFVRIAMRHTQRCTCGAIVQTVPDLQVTLAAFLLGGYPAVIAMLPQCEK